MEKREILTAEGSLMVVKVEIAKGFDGDPEHKHVHEQVTYIEKGVVEFEIEGASKTLKQGDVIYVPSNARHKLKALEDCIVLDTFTPLREDLL